VIFVKKLRETKDIFAQITFYNKMKPYSQENNNNNKKQTLKLLKNKTRL
jgi:hypothetical protein